MKIRELLEGLDANQKRAGQAGPNFKPRSIKVLGKKSTKHPFNGKLVGGDEEQ